ncbi:MAG TPA: UDP-N-acetylmuramoyl-L-alanyl-D-glutamate--2,6-diaminopimelate ligase, partial [Terracidiphilus sp.]|nr:UDP-N-acetylmuramoyl-L-alanyl-D-glutamate--2,6-diaminopimelate ligase [Terracidiphilus sp.]
SREAKAGYLFAALSGSRTDGTRFIAEAVANGAAAVLTADSAVVSDLAVPVILDPAPRRRLALIAAKFHAPQPVTIAAVTGTNGKTSVAAFTRQIWARHGWRAASLGTIGIVGPDFERPGSLTTPDPVVLHRELNALKRKGIDHVALEASSHGLDQNRLDGLALKAAAFTNLTRDHLDYHGTMENYFAAKKLLFDGTRYPAPRVAVLNAMDPASQALGFAARTAGAEVRTYGIQAGDWRVSKYALTPAGATLDLETPAGSATVQSRLAGEVNLLNLLAALTAAHARGIACGDLFRFVPQLKPVPGRFQPVDAGQPFTVIVDYAHTDDALRNLTSLARQMTARSGGRVLTVFGCGGDRDRTKRPKMGQAAGEGSDFVVATSDNPRSEDPRAILAEVEPGLKSTDVRYVIEPDRAAAIHLALATAQPHDVVLIAGKGHEKEQILAGQTIPFDDAEVALSTLSEFGYGKVR